MRSVVSSEAADLFEKAFELKQDPAILYNAAQAHRLAGDKKKALVLYQNFLRLFGEQENRAEVEKRIVELKAAIEAEQAANTNPPTGLMSGKPKRDSRRAAGSVDEATRSRDAPALVATEAPLPERSRLVSAPGSGASSSAAPPSSVARWRSASCSVPSIRIQSRRWEAWEPIDARGRFADLGLAFAVGGCTFKNSCKKGTVLVRASFDGTARTADELDVVVQIDQGPTMTNQLAGPGGQSSGTLEIDFPGGYPTGATLTATVSARLGGVVVAEGSGAVMLDSGCTNVTLAIASRRHRWRRSFDGRPRRQRRSASTATACVGRAATAPTIATARRSAATTCSKRARFATMAIPTTAIPAIPPASGPTPRRSPPASPTAMAAQTASENTRGSAAPRATRSTRPGSPPIRSSSTSATAAPCGNTIASRR